MNPQCSVALLESALAGGLPTDKEAALHQHLEECAECSATLERMAGGAEWCREAAKLLASDELDATLPPREEWSDIDFTVEHLEPSDEPNVLGRLGGYDVLEIVGRGGMGVVLKGFDKELKRCVAIKVLAPHLAQSSLAKKRFAREAQAAAAVVHPNVLAIHQVQASGRLPFLVMPLVAGESLAQRLAAQGALELKEILRIGMQAAAGLAAAHEQGLVHRDVKPANILLEKGVERAVLTDFGLARAADDATLTQGGIAGTPQYMSPEQARGEQLDARSDLFSLGSVLYEMASGVSPFRANSTIATVRRVVDEAPQALGSLNPELPPWFISIVDRLLEKDRARRFSSAQEVSDLLEQCLAHLQQPATSPLPAMLIKPPHRHWWSRLATRQGFFELLAFLGISALIVFMLGTQPPEIAGEWSGDEWGQVVLKKVNDNEYTGTYSDTFGKEKGEIQLKWSRIERRYNGTWREGDARSGEISVRTVGEEIRGGWTTSSDSKINPSTPHLSDLAWTRGPAKAAKGSPPNVSYRMALMPKLQLEKSEAALEKLQAQDAWFHDTSTAEFRIKTARVDALKAEIASFKVAWVKHELSIAQHKSGELSNREFNIALSEINTAEVKLRATQAWAEHRAGTRAFGPVQERLIRANNQAPWPWFDIDTNREITSFDGFAGEDFTADVDFSAGVEPGHGGLGTAGETGFGSVSLEDAQWDAITPEQLVEALKRATVDSIRTEGPLPKTYGFSTRAGGMGLLQIVRYHDQPRGVEIRYKLFLPVEQKTQPGFAPVVEVTLQDPGKGSHPSTFLDLETGQTGSKELILGRKKIFNWALNAGMDLEFSGFSPNEGLQGWRMLVVDVEDSKWDTATPEEVLSNWRLADDFKPKRSKGDALDPVLTDPEELAMFEVPQRFKSGTYFIRTSSNSRGILRVSVSEKPHGVRIRYKLIRSKDWDEGIKVIQSGKGSKLPAGYEPERNELILENAAPSFLWFDLDTGKSLSAQDAFPNRKDEEISDEEYRQWREKNGVDVAAFIEADGTGGLRSLDPQFAAYPLKELQWHEVHGSLLNDLVKAHWKEACHTMISDGKSSATYIFKTGAGRHGLLQITGLSSDPRGVSVRYALARTEAAIKTPVPKPPGLEFGPVIERVLPYGAPCCQQYFQFRSAQVLVVGNGPGTTDEEFERDRKYIDYEAGGADISLGSNSGIQLVGEGCIFTQDLQDLKWDTMTAERAANSMKHANFTFGVVEPGVKDLPATYLFKTSRGDIGILELLGIVDDERGVSGSKRIGRGLKFRYKLVKHANSNAYLSDGVAWNFGRRLRVQADNRAANKVVEAEPRQVFRVQATQRVTVLAYSPDGKLLATGGEPDTVSLIDAQTGKAVSTVKLLTADEEAILANKDVQNARTRSTDAMALTFSPVSNTLAVGSRLGQVKLFDVRTGQLKRSFDGVERVTEDGNKKLLPEFLKLPLAHDNVWALAFSKDGHLLVTCGEAIDYQQDGVRRLGHGPTSGLIKVWDAKSGELMCDLKDEHSGQVVQIGFSRDGSVFGSAGHWYPGVGTPGTGVKLWDLVDTKVTKVLLIPNGHLGGGSPLSFAFSPDGKRIAVGLMQYDKSTDITSGSINLYAAGGVLEASWRVPRAVRPVAFSPDGKAIAAISGKSTLALWNASDGAPLREIRVPDSEGERWEYLAFAPQSPSVAVCGINASGQGIVVVYALDNTPSLPQE